ncbi:MAG: hypothetical protein JSR37_06415 [Verrucomicrobia bacterium]|nr:hypothetical protein [Verrucomicrobiota bacterium]MBS0636464.1 hypothetical protein [Verrucomicrobiota bacterium]
MNIHGSLGQRPEAGPFSVGTKGELLFEGRAPKQVNQISHSIRSNFSRDRTAYVEALAHELNAIYQKAGGTILEATVSLKGRKCRVRVKVENEPQKENITRNLLEQAKLGLGLRQGITLKAKEVLPRTDGDYEVVFEAKEHPGVEISQTFSEKEIIELAKAWDKHQKKNANC